MSYTFGGAHTLVKIQKKGNSQGLLVTKSLLKDARLDVGDEVDVSVKDGVVIVKLSKRIRGRHSFEDLVFSIPQNYEPGEVDSGEPVGKEV